MGPSCLLHTLIDCEWCEMLSLLHITELISCDVTYCSITVVYQPRAMLCLQIMPHPHRQHVNSNKLTQHIVRFCPLRPHIEITCRKQQVEWFVPFWQQVKRNWTCSIFGGKLHDPATKCFRFVESNKSNTRQQLACRFDKLLSTCWFNKLLVWTGLNGTFKLSFKLSVMWRLTSPRLTSSQLTSSHLNWVCCECLHAWQTGRVLWNDPVCHGCNQSQHTYLWWNEVSWDEVM